MSVHVCPRVSVCVREVLLKSGDPHLAGGEQRKTTAAAAACVRFSHSSRSDWVDT